MRAAALALCLLTILLAAGLYIGGAVYLPKEAWPSGLPPAAQWQWLLLAGLAALPMGFVLGLSKARAAGVLLLFGAAIVGLGLALHAGPYLNRYFPGFFLAVLPMATAGILFLLSARKRRG